MPSKICTQWFFASVLKAGKRFKASFLYFVSSIPVLVPHKWVKAVAQDLSWNFGILASDSSIAQLQGDRDKKEGRESASHGAQGVKAMFFVLSVVELEGGYSLCYDLGFCTTPVVEDLILNEHKKNESWVMNNTHTCLSGVIGFTTDGERDDVMCRYSGATFVEA